MLLQETIKTALENLKHIAKTETIFGEAVNVGGVTIIPVSKVSVGFAAGGAGKEAGKIGAGAGTGGGVNITPVALVTIADGDVKVHSLTDWELDFERLLSLAPEAAKKIAAFFKRKKDSGDTDEKSANTNDAQTTNENDKPA